MKKILLFTLTLMLAACSAASAPDLSGEWQLVAYGASANPTPAMPGVATSFTFENGQFSGNAGCNGFGGTYELRGEQIVFSGIMSTMMYCEETAAQEQGVLSALADNVLLNMRVTEKAFTITTQNGATTLVLERK